MLLMDIKKIKKSFGDKEVLREVNLEIKKGKTLGLVGLNGAGKTTLANIIMGLEQPDEGQLMKPQGDIRIGYLRQSTEYTEETLQYLDLEQLPSFLEVGSHLGLNALNTWQTERFKQLSGGEKTKIALTTVWTRNPELLILDEPTNHLDYVGSDWLIKNIKTFKGTVIIISHDRYFLDQTVDQIAELEEGKITLYAGNYTDYREEKKRVLENDKHHYMEQKKQEQHITNEINRLKQWSSKAHRESTKKEGKKEYYRKKAKKKDVQIKSAIKRLEKMKEEGLKKPKEEEAVLFDIVSDGNRGNRILVAEDLTKEFEDRILFKQSQFTIARGERVGLVGINGCGKTTLIQMILQNISGSSGELWVSPTIKIGYLSQDVFDLDESKTLLQLIRKFDKDKQTNIRSMLVSIGLHRAMMDKKIRTFSLGERTRVKLIFLIAEENDVLILDEPTNHLDLHSREQLEETLLSYHGTIIIASHDRYLLEQLTNKCLIFENQTIVRVERGYKEYKTFVPRNKAKQKIERMLIDNRLTMLLSELAKYDSGDEQYQKLDAQYNDLIKERNKLDQ